MKIKRLFVLIILCVLLVFSLYQFVSGEQRNSAMPVDISDDMHDIIPPPDDTKVPIEPAYVEPAYKVIIDPGHGGKDPGAEGTEGRYEKDFALQLSLEVEELLEKESKIQVVLTRNDDTFISSINRERAEFANEHGGDLFVSIHGNGFTDPSVSGTETYYYDEEALPFATIMHDRVIEATGFRDRGVRQENYFVLKETTMPAVLIEVGFLSNLQEEQKMWEDVFRRQIAISIAEGIKEYLETHN